MIISRVGVLSAGIVMGTMYALLGFIIGAVITVLSLAVGGLDQGNPLVGIASIIVLPIAYGIGGFIGGILGAAAYNVAASMVGGLELETDRPRRRDEYGY